MRHTVPLCDTDDMPQKIVLGTATKHTAAKAKRIGISAKSDEKDKASRMAPPVKAMSPAGGGLAVAEVMRGAAARQVLIDAGILTPSGRIRRRFK